MSDLGFNIWGVVTNTLSLLALLPFAWLYTQFPTRKLRSLERFMEETEGLFRKGQEEGLHTNDEDLRQFLSTIWVINLRIDNIRPEVGAISGWRAEVKGWWSGVSNLISNLHQDVSILRDQIIVSGSRDRKRLAEAGYASVLAKYSGAQSQQRRSTIMSYATQENNPLSSSRDSSAQTIPADGECPSAPRTDSPLPILEHDPPHSTLPALHSPAPPSETVDNSTLGADPHHSIPTSDGASHAQDHIRGRRSTRRDMLRRFGSELFIPIQVSRQYHQGSPPQRRGGDRSRLDPFSVVLPSHRFHMVGGVQNRGATRFSAWLVVVDDACASDDAYAFDDEYDDDSENDA